jgi:hypothetical protein
MRMLPIKLAGRIILHGKPAKRALWQIKKAKFQALKEFGILLLLFALGA